MASSAQFIPYVVDTYHDPGYVGGEHRLVVELVAQDASVSGVAEVTKAGSGAVQAQDATVSATTKRTVIVLNADLHDGPATIVDVAGDGERSVVTVVSAVEHDTPSQVTGVAERTVNGSGALSIGESSVTATVEISSNALDATPQAQSSTVTGSANAQRNASGAIQAQDATTVGVSERTIVDTDTTLAAQSSTVSAVSEREIDDQGGNALSSQDAALSGVAERVITSSGSLESQPIGGVVGSGNNGRVTSPALQTGSSVVTGEAENIITGTGSLQQSSVPVVSGIAERIVTGSAALKDNDHTVFGISTRTVVDVDATPQAQSSSVTGLAENSIVSQSAALQAQSSTTVGAAERIIVQEGNAQFKPTDNNVVTGQGTRKKNASGALQQSSVPVVTGVAERIITPDDANLTASEVGVSVVTGVTERVIVQTGDGSLEAQSSTTVGVAERTIVQEGAASFKPTNNNVLVGAAERVITGIGDLHDGPVTLTDVAGDGERQINNVLSALTHDDDADVVAVANIGRVTDVTLDNIDSSLVNVTITRGSNQLDGGTFKPSENNLVVGVAERVVTTGTVILQTSEVITGPVAGVGEREIVTESASLQTGSSVVTGEAENKIVSQSASLQAQSSVTVCSAERVIVQQSGGVLKPTNNNTVSGLAEVKKTGSGHLAAIGWGVGGTATRIIVDEDTTPSAQPSTVAGVGVRTSNTLDGALTAAEIGVSVVAGNGERSIVTESAATVVDDPSDVVGVAEREITGTGTVGHRFIPETVIHTVTNNGTASWKVDGNTNPTLEFHRGSTYRFTVNASGHPFWIKSSPGNGTANAYNDGVTNNGDDVGTVVFVVPFNAPDTLYYNCQFHGSMAGTINVSPALSNQLQNSAVAGIAERELLAGNVAISLDNSVVTATTEITSNSQGQLVAQDVVIAGVSERTIVDVNTAVAAQDVIVSAVSEREMRTAATLTPTANNIVAGVAERIIDAGSVALQPTENNVVVSTSERTIVAVDINLTASEVGVSVVAGIGEREVITEESALIVDDPSDVAGTAERIITGSGERITHMVSRSGNSAWVIDGVQNRTLEFHKGSKYIIKVSTPGHPFWIKSIPGTSFPSGTGTENAYNDGVTNNGEDNGTIIFDVPLNAPDTLYYNCQYHSAMAGTIDVQEVISPSAQESTVSGVAERSITSIHTALETTPIDLVAVTGVIIKPRGDIKLVPSRIFGIATRVVVDQVPNPAAQSSTIAGIAERIVELEVEGAIDGDVNTGPSTVAGIAEREIRSAVTLSAQDVTVSGIAEREIRSAVTLSTSDAIVSGAVEREITGVDTNLTASEVGVSAVVGNAERKVVVAEGNISASEVGASVVVGVAERTVGVTPTPKAQESIVSGIAERTVVSVNTAVAAQDIRVVSSAERIITSVEADLSASEVGVSVVAGVAEREIDDDTGNALVTGQSSATGVAERIIKVPFAPDSNGVAIPRSGPSTVNAVTKRTVFVIEADLTADEVGVSVVAGSGTRREVSAAVPLVRSFRITKPKLATIVIRTKPSAVEAV